MMIKQFGQAGYDALFKRAHSIMKRSDAIIAECMRLMEAQ